MTQKETSSPRKCCTGIDNFTFEFFRKKLETIEKIVTEIKQKENTMPQTLQDLRDAITALDTKIDEDLTQTGQIIVAVNALIAKIGTGTPPADFQAEVDAVNALITKLTSDNPAVQAAIDAANAQP